MKLCGNGLHPKLGLGKCIPCKRATQKRFQASAKGRAITKRYYATPKGRVRLRAGHMRWRIKNRQKHRDAARAYHEANREKRLAQMREYYLRSKAEGGTMSGAFWVRQARNAA